MPKWVLPVVGVVFGLLFAAVGGLIHRDIAQIDARIALFEQGFKEVAANFKEITQTINSLQNELIAESGEFRGRLGRMEERFDEYRKAHP